MAVTAVIEMEAGGRMVFELYPDKAPVTVENFRHLAQSGFFDGLTFHRVVEGFVIQGGSADNTCNCPCDFTIRGEFRENGIDTGLEHIRGTISMARDEEFDSAGTQFFVVHQDAHRLDGKYAAFGKMIEGFDMLDRIASTPTEPPGKENRPLQAQVIRCITVKCS